nr:hypothetical protein [Mycoplasmopsis bovis]
MAVEDLNEIDWKYDDYNLVSNNDVYNNTDPTIEPIVGVIDYNVWWRFIFLKWVEFKKDNFRCIIPLSIKKIYILRNGCNILLIVNGPSFNKDLEDNCS